MVKHADRHSSSIMHFPVRVEKYGRVVTKTAENLCYGPETAREIVLDLLMDDGVLDRGHRRVLLARQYV